ncbi:malate dehydrogenase, putative [Perkinsus marinus ATCC 50983]|uniref:malate dehydrogenase n=1 Tax=Perkinsus marinus (strain ATCC 50983 / TXsc) TaxID=423536 RepID=C5M156_PERM5|nr:malate dehydrogenase, putative [Perkinsus marinus ATCC 50983]EEQ97286.1 malate dehydrogenase, putative [Perkinsus marinus ATCC 50983]|eukprot:XP_002764569.1 malate dehydrogenase, putative [Perkinsus marinus ATCC 50983]
MTKVSLLGASGGIGQPLSMLLKLNPMITKLALYDIKQAMVPCAGVAADVSHINTPAKVVGYAGDDEIESALSGANVIVMTAGVPRKPGMTRDDLFKINAGIVRGLATASAKYAPNATLCIVSNPVNSTVPIAAEIYKKAGVFDPKKIVGVTQLDITRANTFVSEKTGMDVQHMDVPVIGGHAGETIMTLFSQARPEVKLDQATIEELDKRIQNAGTEVVEAKNGAGSATLSMAYAAAKFVDVVIRGQCGQISTACAYINEPFEDVSYFSYRCDFGPEGVSRIHPLEGLTPYEKGRLEEVKRKLKGDIQNGITFANN